MKSRIYNSFAFRDDSGLIIINKLPGDTQLKIVDFVSYVLLLTFHMNSYVLHIYISGSIFKSGQTAMKIQYGSQEFGVAVFDNKAM